MGHWWSKWIASDREEPLSLRKTHGKGLHKGNRGNRGRRKRRALVEYPTRGHSCRQGPDRAGVARPFISLSMGAIRFYRWSSRKNTEHRSISKGDPRDGRTDLVCCDPRCSVDQPQEDLEKCDSTAGVYYVHIGGWVVAWTTARLTTPGADEEY